MTEFKWPRSSCGPQALWYIVGGDREEYLATWKRMGEETGWRPGRGVSLIVLAQMARVFGWAFRPFTGVRGMTLGQFKARHPDQRVLVMVYDHFLVIDHGTVVDPMHGNKPQLRRRIKGCYTLHKETT